MIDYSNNPEYVKDIKQILSDTLPWYKLKGKKILVTGATGMICSVLVDTLMMNPIRDYEVYICGRNESLAKERFHSYWNEKSFHFIKQDLANGFSSSVKFHYIIHGAGYSYPSAFSQDPVGTILGTINGTASILESAVKTGTLIRMLFISTGEVYGQADVKSWKEHDSGYVDVLDTRSCYPTAKRAAENLCIAYSEQYGLNITIARLSHIYGATFSEKDNRAYAQFLSNAIEKQDIVLKSNGLQTRSYCYVADCVSALLHVFFKGEKGTAYNIADDNNIVSIKQLSQIIANLSGINIKYEIPIAEESKGYSKTQTIKLDTSRIKSLGWKPYVSLVEGINKILFVRNKTNTTK